jgi:hypothetical protein
MKQVVVVRKVIDGYAVEAIGTDDPHEAMRYTRNRAVLGTDDTLYAFKIEDHDGTPMFVPVGQLDPPEPQSVGPDPGEPGTPG